MSIENIQSAERLFNDPNRIPIGVVSKKLFQIIREVHQSRQMKLITINGRAVAAICPLIDAAKLQLNQRGTINVH
jgi:hypothetical protein